MGASPRAGGQGFGTRLVQEQIAFATGRKLHYLVLGARVSRYARYHRDNQGVGIGEYVKMTKWSRKDNRDLPIDAELRFYTRCGLELVNVIPNYMEDDPESENYGAVMVWTNPNI